VKIKMKVRDMMLACEALYSMTARNAVMSTKGRYRVTKMYAQLRTEYGAANDQRSAIIAKLRIVKQDLPDGGFITKVHDDDREKFEEEWKPIGDDECEVDVQPIPLSSISSGADAEGAPTMIEILNLGPLVHDDEEEV
jgi:hypothetical protein